MGKELQRNNRKFYYSTWFIVLWIIIFFPVGFYLLYKRCKQNNQNQKSNQQLWRYLNNQQRQSSHQTSYYDSQQRYSAGRTQTLSRQQENEIINDIIIDETMLDDIINRFKAIPNWKNYRKTTHTSPEQIIRMKRALYGGSMRLLSYDNETGKAFVHGQSYRDYYIDANGCTCEDFQRRQKPCKHMYFAAIHAPLNLPSIPLLFSEHDNR